MKIEITIDEREINNIGGKHGEDFIIAEFKRDPKWFIENASDIKVLQLTLAQADFMKCAYANSVINAQWKKAMDEDVDWQKMTHEVPA